MTTRAEHETARLECVTEIGFGAVWGRKDPSDAVDPAPIDVVVTGSDVVPRDTASAKAPDDDAAAVAAAAWNDETATETASRPREDDVTSCDAAAAEASDDDDDAAFAAAMRNAIGFDSGVLRGRKDPSDRLRRLGPQGPDAVDAVPIGRQASAAKPIETTSRPREEEESRDEAAACVMDTTEEEAKAARLQRDADIFARALAAIRLRASTIVPED
jgi:hypothetical protein